MAAASHDESGLQVTEADHGPRFNDLLADQRLATDLSAKPGAGVDEVPLAIAKVEARVRLADALAGQYDLVQRAAADERGGLVDGKDESLKGARGDFEACQGPSPVGVSDPGSRFVRRRLGTAGQKAATSSIAARRCSTCGRITSSSCGAYATKVSVAATRRTGASRSMNRSPAIRAAISDP